MPNWMSTFCEIVGFVAVVAGISTLSVPLAFIVGGSLLIAAGALSA